MQNVKKWLYHIKHRYFTMDNIVIGVAVLIAIGFAWGSVTRMQRNYTLQRQVDAAKRQQQILELEVATKQYEQNYYKSDEYKDLAAREHLGLASPGEKVLILPANSPAAKKEDTPAVQKAAAEPPSNFEQWINFLSGNSAANIDGLQK